jgi:succinate dehydrogenase/fumarate reductase flavoprotein subunit
MIVQLQQCMADDVGPLRTGNGLARALDRIGELDAMLGERPFGRAGAFDLERLDWFDLRNMLTVARSVAQSALARTESRGAHQREDYPGMIERWRVNQVVRPRGKHLELFRTAATPAEVVAQ